MLLVLVLFYNLTTYVIKDFRTKRKFGMSDWKASKHRTRIRWEKVFFYLNKIYNHQSLK